MQPESKMGQMTNAGYNLTMAYHKKIVEDALKENKPVPEKVLLDYPELINYSKNNQIPINLNNHE